MTAPDGGPLDVFAAPLAGVIAVEASAGTGKTFAITDLYVRHLLDGGLGVGDVLVVTYTNAATAELRDRIRRKLVAVRRALERGDPGDDDFCRTLLARLRPPERAAAARTLGRGLQGFDEAAIFTIHGFCRRVLAERAFGSGVAFELELVPDQLDLVQAVVDDFWRRAFYEASDPFVAYAVTEKKLTPEALVDLVRAHGARPYRAIDAPPDPGDLTTVEAAFTTAHAAARAGWDAGADAIATLVRMAPGLNRNRYRIASLDGWFLGIEAYLRERAPLPVPPRGIERLCARALAEGTRAGAAPPLHPFFDACDALVDAAAALRPRYDARLAALRARLVAEAGTELARRKAERGVQYYDDLLAAVDRALADPARGPALAAALRTRYRAALVDEFQDTDPVQYDILRRVYGGGTTAVVLVGDPKQAIYAFRGADVFTYLRARADAARRYHLERNWRSEPGLVTAVNAVFAGRARPFVMDAIDFVPALPADRARPPLVVEDDDGAPLRLWLLGEGELLKGDARAAAVDATARETARLLALGAAGRARLGDEGIHGGHVAVLVRTNDEGRAMRERLLALGIPSVQHAVDSVFRTREAIELERVLLAIADPGQGGLVRAALATEMLGVDATGIVRLADDERDWERWVEAFHDHHDAWREHGFARMFRALLWRHDVPARLLAHDDGERRLTNLLHLAELLGARAAGAGGGMDALVEWLADERRVVRGEPDEHQLRLESDERLVQIVTVHKAKGLQYPIVFCPFLWDGRLHVGTDVVAVHEGDGDGRATLDLGSPAFDARKALARREELAEKVRLAYVALTRASHRCYVAWGLVKEGGTAPLAWLLHAPPGGAAAGEDAIAAVAARYGALDAAGLRADLARLVERAGGAIRVEAAPATGAPPRPPGRGAAAAPGAARRLRRPLPAPWTMTSFSRLAAGLDAELPDHDAMRADEREAAHAPARHDRFGFPRGGRAGTCLHAALERADFTRPDGWARVAAEALRAHGFAAAWEPVVVDLIARVAATALDDGGTVRLERVPMTSRLAELEFHHPVVRLDAGRLRRLLEEHGFGEGAVRDAVAALRFAPVTGFVKGFIDLVFACDGRYWLVDYKSTWLGDEPDDYAAAHLSATIAREHHWLQYLLYTVVVHRLLRLRLRDYDYDAHVGGVRYLFLRGLDPARGPATGVYADRVPRALALALDAMMGTPA